MSSQSEYTLEKGLKLLKEKNDRAAKQVLESVAKNSANPWVAIQAQIGLVVACARIDEIDNAIAVCNILRDSNRTEVKAWAVKVGKILATRKSIQDAQANGFVPIDAASSESFDILELTPPGSNSALVKHKAPNPGGESTPKLTSTSKNRHSAAILWRNAGRAKTWQGLNTSKLWHLWALEALTLIAIAWLVKELVTFTLEGINSILIFLPWLEPVQLFYQDPSLLILTILAVGALASPWLLSIYLDFWYGLRPLEPETLGEISPESLRIIKRYIQPHKIQLPKLFLIPVSTPLIFTWGHLPRTMRIGLSQGLIDILADDEIAVLMTGQLAHNRHWDMAVISFVLTLTLPIYQLYCLIANWGDQISQPLIKSIAAAIASIIYLIWCLISGTVICLNRMRLEYSDRFATNTTGNPNGLIRALLKISVAIAASIKNQGGTPWHLESLNIAAPVSFQQSITTGSLAPQISWESLLMWDYLHPYRHWLNLNNTHPLLGDRIQKLAKIARQLHLEPELDLVNQPPLQVSRQKFLIQIAPFCLAIPFGLLMAGIIGGTWQLAFTLKLINLKWIYDNWNFVTGCILIGFSLGTLVRIEPLFPNIKTSSLQAETQIAEIIANPTSLPVQPYQVQLQGKLIGRVGIANTLGQDLILETHRTLIPLHYIARPAYPISIQNFIGRQVKVTGWLRRGATPWIDIQSIQTQSQKIPNLHPTWSYTIAFAAGIWGAVILLRGY